MSAVDVNGPTLIIIELDSYTVEASMECADSPRARGHTLAAREGHVLHAGIYVAHIVVEFNISSFATPENRRNNPSIMNPSWNNTGLEYGTSGSYDGCAYSRFVEFITVTGTESLS
jgi:hypothetical protein